MLNDSIDIIVFVQWKWSWGQIRPLHTRKLEGVDSEEFEAVWAERVSNANTFLQSSSLTCCRRSLVISCVSCWRRSTALLGRSLRDASLESVLIGTRESPRPLALNSYGFIRFETEKKNKLLPLETSSNKKSIPFWQMAGGDSSEGCVSN